MSAASHGCDSSLTARDRVRVSTAATGVTALLLLGAVGCGEREAGVAPIAAASPGPAAREAFYATPFARTPSAAELTALGRELFFDPVLSSSGRISCASCHDPAHAYGPADGASTPRGGKDGTARGFRAAPSLRYLQSVPVFTEHMHDTDGDDSVDQGPAGGRTWDGRAQSAHAQAQLPLLSPSEMANATPADLVGRLRFSASGAQMRATFGDSVFDDPRKAFNGLVLALEVFQQDPEAFYPYSSKYDEFLRGRLQLSAREARGLEAFNDPSRGNCASCHPSRVKEGALPALTDFGYVALGVPRNRALPANRDAAFHDLGVCGPLRSDLSGRDEYCGLFRTPSLRNVAVRKSFFHNGVFHTLERVLEFYALRDVAPERWYVRDRDGRVRKFDDLPAAYAVNVNVEAPFDRQRGGRPALSPVERADIIAFLKTLTDADLTARDKAPAGNYAGARAREAR